MALARVVLAALLCFSVASARDILQDAAADTALISGEGILPVMPAMNMLTGAAAAHHQAALAPDPPLPNAASGPNGVNRVLKPAAFMPGNAASNASVAMGFLVAPLMMQRGPMRARFNAPVLPDTVPAELAGLPPGVQRALGFTITQAPKPGACGGRRRRRARQLTPPCAQAARPAAARPAACPRWPRTTTRSPASCRAAEPWGEGDHRMRCAPHLLQPSYSRLHPRLVAHACCALAMASAMSASAATRARPSRRRSAAASAASASLPPASTAADTAPISRLCRPRQPRYAAACATRARTAPRRPAQ
jgi:hypothetical protein